MNPKVGGVGLNIGKTPRIPGIPSYAFTLFEQLEKGKGLVLTIV